MYMPGAVCCHSTGKRDVQLRTHLLTLRPCGHNSVFIVDMIVVHVVARQSEQRIVIVIIVRRAQPEIAISIQSLYVKKMFLLHTVYCHFLPMLQADSDSHITYG